MIFILTYFQKKSSLLIRFNLYFLKLTEANYSSRNVSREIKKKRKSETSGKNESVKFLCATRDPPNPWWSSISISNLTGSA